jgi:hypothetical protein
MLTLSIFFDGDIEEGMVIAKTQQPDIIFWILFCRKRPAIRLIFSASRVWFF